MKGRVGTVFIAMIIVVIRLIVISVAKVFKGRIGEWIRVGIDSIISSQSMNRSYNYGAHSVLCTE